MTPSEEIRYLKSSLAEKERELQEISELCSRLLEQYDPFAVFPDHIEDEILAIRWWLDRAQS